MQWLLSLSAHMLAGLRTCLEEKWSFWFRWTAECLYYVKKGDINNCVIVVHFLKYRLQSEGGKKDNEVIISVQMPGCAHLPLNSENVSLI